ncbi:hypothetical protein ACTFIV_008570 [Dictyostelium citrinum]
MATKENKATTTTTTSTSTSTSTTTNSNNNDSTTTTTTQPKKDIYVDVDWKELTPIGFEFNTWDSMKKEGWTFPELKREFKRGVLSNIDTDKPLYMFLGAQPIVEGDYAFNMPYIVVFDCPSPPPSKICKASIQGGSEDVYNFSDFHLSWSPYIPSRYANQAQNKKYKIFTLNLQERPGKKISEEKQLNIQYLLPYILIPKIFKTFTVSQVTNVQFILKDCKLTKEAGEKLIKERKQEEEAYKKWVEENKGKKKDEKTAGPAKPPTKLPFKVLKDADGKVTGVTKDLEIYFDKLSDSIKTYPGEFVEDNGLEEEMVEVIDKAIRDEFVKARAVAQKKYDSLKAEIDSYSPKKAEDYDNCKIYKFYPRHKKYNIQKYVSPAVNRFFGNATQTFPDALKLSLTDLKEVDADVVKKIADEDKKSWSSGTKKSKESQIDDGRYSDSDESSSEQEESEDEVPKKEVKKVAKKAATKPAPAKPAPKQSKKKAAAKKSKAEEKKEEKEEKEEKETKAADDKKEEKEKEEKEEKKEEEKEEKETKADEKEEKETKAADDKKEKEEKEEKETKADEKETKADEKEEKETKANEKEEKVEEKKDEDKMEEEKNDESKADDAEDKVEKPKAKVSKGKNAKETKETTTKTNGKRKEPESTASKPAAKNTKESKESQETKETKEKSTKKPKTK